MKTEDKVILCSRCVLDTTDDPKITFDANGVCNYCRDFESSMARLGTRAERKTKLAGVVSRLREAGKNKDYDCILGVSGGVDSSYLAYWLKNNGTRPLIVHVDNGWNSELAVQNIHTLCTKLDLPLKTHVINWEEFRQLQLAYIRAGVVDIEALTDHAIYALVLEMARKHRIRYLISGFNVATEGVMPRSWVFNKTDFRNIKDIASKFGNVRIKSFPHLTFAQRLYHTFFVKTETVQLLNLIDYNKEECKRLLQDKLGWRDYGGKHYESVFTKFYQAYILPRKFGIDKRKAHLSSLIGSGQITREEALSVLRTPLYESETQLENERTYVLKKLGMSAAEFEDIMKRPARKHTDFLTEESLWKKYFRLLNILRGRRS